MREILHYDLALHNVPRIIVDKDISVFFVERFREIRNDSEHLPVDWPDENSVNFLVQRAEGLFIFAATVCRFVEGEEQWSPEALLKAFLPSDGSEAPYNWDHDIPSTSPTLELDQMYTKILRHSFKGVLNDRDKVAERFRQVVGSLVILFEPLSETTLARLLGLSQHSVNLRLRHLHSVLNIPNDQGAPIRLSHPSFRDFLLDKDRCRDQTFCVDEKQRNKALLECCLRLLSSDLRKDICRLQAPGSLAQGVETSTIKRYISSDVRYACLYWTQHLQGSDLQLHDNDQVHQFLRSHLLHWLETLAWLGKTSEGILAIISLKDLIQVGIIRVGGN